MIHLDSYLWDGEVFIRVWDTENPDSLMESVERPPLRQVLEHPLGCVCGNCVKLADLPKPTWWQKFWSKDWEKP